MALHGFGTPTIKGHPSVLASVLGTPNKKPTKAFFFTLLTRAVLSTMYGDEEASKHWGEP